MNTKPPEYLKHVDDLTLGELIEEQKHILSDCIECASLQRKNTEYGGWNVDGLYYANLRYEELIAELQRRFNEIR